MSEGRNWGGQMTIKVRGIEFQSNIDNAMGLQFTNLSDRWRIDRRTPPVGYL